MMSQKNRPMNHGRQGTSIFIRRLFPFVGLAVIYSFSCSAMAQEKNPTGVSVDLMREMQSEAIQRQSTTWGHWGNDPTKYSNWVNHSNRLIPVYTFGIDLDVLRNAGSVYADPARMTKLFGTLPEETVNPTATYFDQTDVYRLQQQAVAAGKRYIILIVFDGMDWQTTRAAAIYKTGHVSYERGRGTGLAFQDDRSLSTDFGFIVTTAQFSGAKHDINAQTVTSPQGSSKPGFDATRGGIDPWHENPLSSYLMGTDREVKHIVTDSAASATSLTAGVKTYNGAINYLVNGDQVEPMARTLQRERGFMVGVVSSVPVSHATPAAAYANNVSRKDYQDLSRDMVGLPSISHRTDPLPGVDVLIGGGWGEGESDDSVQGDNFQTGNVYFHQDDLRRVDVTHGGKYLVVERQAGVPGGKSLAQAATEAASRHQRLIGYFGTKKGHLPFQTADGKFDPTFDLKGTERYTAADIVENPSLAEITDAALEVLQTSEQGFWLMIEAGDVDWANHANNLDNSIGAVLSGEAAFERVMDWIKRTNRANETVVILTSDHGHHLVIDDPEQIAAAGRQQRETVSTQ
jgi:alkaline phosphatase